MENTECLVKELYCCEYEVNMVATHPVCFEAWVGAIVRNNIVYHLERHIDSCPLLKGGFPKGYVLTNFSHFSLDNDIIYLNKGQYFSFSLILIGVLNEYFSLFEEALQQMCVIGFGKNPQTSKPTKVGFTDLNITKGDTFYWTNSLSFEKAKEDTFYQNKKTIGLKIKFLTPTQLVRIGKLTRKETPLGSQAKANCFPSLYQIVHTAVCRLQNLYNIYINKRIEQISAVDDNFMRNAAFAQLQSADLQFIKLKNTLKKETKNEQPLRGFIGEQIYEGYLQDYIPILQFMSKLGIGNETAYGLGNFEIEIVEK
ncbi:MAG: CRISPR system precrRNA processing endoribonuclease RAMP protein Cas6 [Bacteroidales bacterium]|nr:CRISPR system precrRNA processing endoribonuclease RAMP protein Cas6 [Bacteroidales bacterium]